MTVAASTRALPPAAPAATQTAAPSDDLQAVFAALAPGDVVELADGTYAVDELYLDVAGTADAPIYIRGASRSGVVLDDPTGRVLQLQAASHVIIENLTLQGSGTDSGTDASSNGVGFWDGALQENVTIRSVDILGVDMGVVAWGTTHSLLGLRLRTAGQQRVERDVPALQPDVERRRHPRAGRGQRGVREHRRRLRRHLRGDGRRPLVGGVLLSQPRDDDRRRRVRRRLLHAQHRLLRQLHHQLGDVRVARSSLRRAAVRVPQRRDQHVPRAVQAQQHQQRIPVLQQHDRAHGGAHRLGLGAVQQR